MAGSPLPHHVETLSPAPPADAPAVAVAEDRHGSLDVLVKTESRRRRRRQVITWVIAGVVVLGVAALVVSFVTRGKPPLETLYKTENVSKGDVLRVVTATGRLEARSTVEVSSKISGRVAAVKVGFNAHVKRDDVLAELDTTALEAQKAQAEANLALARAAVAHARIALEDARTRLDRVEKLFARGVETDANRDAARLAVRLAEADIASAEAQVSLSAAAARLAAANLADATIRAPIDGVIISRSVEPGQTVAAALSAPVLFVMAEDLTKMRVVASVDEADIGAVKLAQNGTFTVDAFPGSTFHAAVTEIRSSPVVVSNVVTYETLLDVENPEGKLRPGMTASVRLETDSAHDVLRVPNAALRFTPPGEKVPEGGGAFVWVFGDGGTLASLKVETGISDGHLTEAKGADLAEGRAVLIDVSDVGRKVLGLERPK